MKVIKFPLILLILLILTSGCTGSVRYHQPEQLIVEIINYLQGKENIVFLLNSTMILNDKIATVNLKGVQFNLNGQTYYLGNTAGYPLELFEKGDRIYIKNIENQWVELQEAKVPELKSFISAPLTLLNYTKYGDFSFLDSKVRVSRKKQIILSGTLKEEGVIKFLENLHLEPLENTNEYFVELSLYIDKKKRTLSKIDLFVTELSGQFSLVTEIIITNYNVKTDIIPPQ
ncbi:hypothetical protein SAMN02745227_01199 [Anaerobranca californiensis DSM 14826]|jgi:hypothetical protein|uniref:Outer membrane lipoprotein-sorting protein n=1 Tax=Anaerobranca californiensis DSM 14826 TaxID=1120989 RepID=A0A1M6NNQ1_9FIRM|nr:hypothetical protein [Anaerobranca californiensis]SHJ97288.1 hypothetical protein SAMN02745227_01199 [Anaerobranca californiensis DSM 14826]